MNDSDALEELRSDRIQLYKWNLPASYSQFFTAAGCALCNFLVALNCFTSKTLRRRSYYIVMTNLAIADAWIGAAYMYVTGRRLRDHYVGQGNLRTELQCLTDIVPMTFGLVASTVFTLALCCDRCAALLWPQKYIVYSHRCGALVILAGWLYTCADSVIALSLSIDEPDNVTPMCTNSGVYGNAYNIWLLVSTITYSCLALGLSLACLFRVLHQIKIRAEIGSRTGELLESAGTIAIIAGLLVLTQVASRIGYLYLAQLPKRYRSRFGNFMRLPQMLSSMVNLFVYLARSSMFRQEFMALLRMRTRGGQLGEPDEAGGARVGPIDPGRRS